VTAMARWVCDRRHGKGSPETAVAVAGDFKIKWNSRHGVALGWNILHTVQPLDCL